MMNMPYMGKCSQCDFPATSGSFDGSTSTLYCAKHAPFIIALHPTLLELQLEAENAALKADAERIQAQTQNHILAAIAAAVKAERERCAKLIENASPECADWIRGKP